MTQVIKEGYKFTFPNAIDAFPFDVKRGQPGLFHGAPMKVVDVIAEFNLYDVFLEIKNYLDGNTFMELNIEKRFE